MTEIEMIRHILEVHERQINSEDDLYPDLPDDEGYVLEAVSAVACGWHDSPLVRAYLACPLG